MLRFYNPCYRNIGASWHSAPCLTSSTSCCPLPVSPVIVSYRLESCRKPSRCGLSWRHCCSTQTATSPKGSGNEGTPSAVKNIEIKNTNKTNKNVRVGGSGFPVPTQSLDTEVLLTRVVFRSEPVRRSASMPEGVFVGATGSRMFGGTHQGEDKGPFQSVVILIYIPVK